MKIVIQTLFFFLLVTEVGFAQWVQSNGPYGGGDVYRFLKLNNNIYVGTSDGVFVSDNGGASWNSINNGLRTKIVHALATDGKNIYAGEKGIKGGFKNPGVKGGIFRLSDEGSSWSEIENNLCGISIIDLTIIHDPSRLDSVNLFAGTYYGVFLSTDCGQIWTQVNSGLKDTFVTCLHEDNSNLFVGTSSGIFRSTNKGGAWTEVNSGLTNNFVNCMVNSGINLFAGTDGGVFLSKNDGENWIEVNSGLTNLSINTLAVDGINLYAGTHAGVFLSTNNGTNWIEITNDLINKYVVSLFIDSNEVGEAKLFAGTIDGIHISTNNGTSWIEANNGLMIQHINTLETISDTIGKSKLFASVRRYKGLYSVYNDGVFESSDDGVNWIRAKTPFPNFSCIKRVDENLVACTSNGIFLSTDSGISWTAVNYTFPYGGVYDFAVIGTSLFAVTNFGIFLSTDNYKSWTEVNNGVLNQTQISSLAVSNQNLFAGVFNYGVSRTTNNGQNWYTVNNGMTNLCVSDIIAVPDNFGSINLYTGNYASGGVFLSTNNGANWTLVNNGLLNTEVRLLTASGTNLFAGTNEGLFLTENCGTNWVQVDDSLFKWITALAVSEKNIFVGTEASGVWHRELLEMITDVENPQELLTNYELEQNYPNPFNPTTKIKYGIPLSPPLLKGEIPIHRDGGFVTLKVYDVLGREVTTLVNEEKSPGNYEVEFNAEKLSSGVYFYKLSAGSFVETKKMILLK